DEIETQGIDRARGEMERADLILWLGPEGEASHACWEIDARCDLPHRSAKNDPAFRVSAITGEGLDALRRGLIAHATGAMPCSGEAALSKRQRNLLTAAGGALLEALEEGDLLCLAELLRQARLA